MKHKTLGIIVILVIVVALLFLAQRMITPSVVSWGATDIACLRFGHQNLAQHFHPTLTIIVDDEREAIPENIGISDTCMAEAHTHDTTGTLHFESVEPGKTFTVEDFFAVWGQSIERDGYALVATINGISYTVEEMRTTPLHDQDAIVLTYTPR
jgi:hypothetical protein